MSLSQWTCFGFGALFTIRAGATAGQRKYYELPVELVLAIAAFVGAFL